MQNEEDKSNDQPSVDDARSVSDDHPQQDPAVSGADPSTPAETPRDDSAAITDEETTAATPEVVETADAGDAVAVSDQPTGDQKRAGTGPIDWTQETSAHVIEIELKHIETSVRTALEAFDTKRKRRLGGTQRWRELERDISSWRFTGRFSEEAAQHLLHLISRRHALYQRLSFVASTRPTWNT